MRGRTCAEFAIVVAALGASLIAGPEIAALGAAYVLITDAGGPATTKCADRMV
jgi:hypothetical protein